MAGAALILAAIVVCRPSPVGRKGTWLLYVEAVMVTLAGIWAAAVIVDPAYGDSSNPLLLAGDASWPLHQALMLVIGIVAVRANRWPSPAGFALFGPSIGVILVVTASGIGVDIVAATAIGAGWVTAAWGVFAATTRPAARRESTDPALQGVPA